MDKFKKIDFIIALIIGEIAGLLMMIIGKNIAGENIAVAQIVFYLNYLPIVFPIVCAIGIVVAYILNKIIPIVYQFAKFVLVGGLNFLIDMGVLNFLIFFTGITAGIEQTFFKGFSFLVATINSYFWNKFWTFKRSEKENVGKEFFEFFTVSTIGFLINVGVDYIFVNLISPLGGMGSATWAQFSAMIAAIVALFWNFIGYKFIVFDLKKNE